MKVLLAEHLGFCFGVERAVQLAEEAAAQGVVCTLGPLIHNRRVVERLEAAGVRWVSGLDEAKGAVILRTHGVGPAVYEGARRRGLEVVDATCPFVRRAREEAAHLQAEGYQVVVVGDARHPEVLALQEWLQGKAWVVADRQEARQLPASARVGVVAQTTVRREVLAGVVEELQATGAEVRVADTICTATTRRQQATRALAHRVAVTLVVGGRESANTRRLWEIAREEGCPAYLVEGAEEIRPEWLQGKDTVGIAAGASTPDWAVKEVVAKVQELTGEDRERVSEGEEEEAAALEVALADPLVAVPDDAPSAPAEEPAPADERAPADEPAPAADATGAPAAQAVQPERPAEAEPAEQPAVAEQEAQAEQATQPAQAEQEAPAEQVDNDARLLEESLEVLQPGDLVQGRVVEVGAEGVLVDVGYKSEGIIPLAELSRRRFSSPEEIVQPGEEITVYVLSVDNQEQTLKLSKKRADEILAWEQLREAKEKGTVLEAEAIQEVKGGLVVDVGLRGFVPASQIERGYVQDLGKYVGHKLRLRVIELDRGKNRAILSQRVVIEEERRRAREDTWSSISEGQVRTGVVKSITDFGAFIDVGGVDGLLHVSEMAWGRVNHPSEVLQEGQTVDVMVLRLDREKGKISLGLKQTMPDPWENVSERYPIGAVVSGHVTRLAPFGAFVELEPGVEGLIHLSELSSDRVSRAEDVLNVGEEVKVKVLRVRPHDRRIGLSLRQVGQDQERTEIKRFLTQQGGSEPLSTQVSEVLTNKENNKENHEA